MSPSEYNPPPLHKHLNLAISITFVCFLSLYFSSISYARDVWEYLEREGNSLDLMALDTIESSAVLVGAKFEQRAWQSTEDSVENKGQPQTPGKQLHIISINQNESIEWKRSYLAIPEVNEIFSVSSTSNGRLCIVYGRYYAEGELINPVILQVDSKGKIIWANNKTISESNLMQFSKGDSVQIANLDSIHVIDTPDNGCLLGYILRHQRRGVESFQLHLLLIDNTGKQRWNYNSETHLYGKMFLVRNKDKNQYTVVQTNQSRDAAIEAMMAAKPFSPATSATVISLQGKLERYHESFADLSKVWVKAIVDAPGSSIMLVGNSTNAWAGYLDIHGRIHRVLDGMEGEFSFVRMRKPEGLLFVRGRSIVVTDNSFALKLNKSIGQLIKKKYSNPYMDKQIPESVPIQNIVSLGENLYLILYKLGNKLLKIGLPDQR